MPSANRSLIQRAAVVASLMFVLAPPVVAQRQMPAPASDKPDFLTRYDYHLAATALSGDDPRFSWDTHFGGELDVIDYVVGRASALIDYGAVLGNQFRSFDPNQGNYILETSLSLRAGKTEFAAFFHHESRHLSDRAKLLSIAWNTAGVRGLGRASFGASTLDVSAEGGYVTEHAYVDYKWIGQADMLARFPLNSQVGLFAHGSGQLYGLNPAIADRERQAGGLVEGGVRLNGRAGAFELFAGYEKRVDADPLARQPEHWGLAGFRIVGR